jgi:acyl dehydratase
VPRLFFEDLTPGRVSTYGGHRVDRDEMVAFAQEFDPQPFHTDEAAARHTFVGRLIASGWYTGALQMRMLCDAWLLDSSSMGGPGIDELTWLHPVVPGDTLSVRQSILDAKPSRSRSEMGLVRFKLETLNGSGEVVMVQVHTGMFGRRGAAAPTPEATAAGRVPDQGRETASTDIVERRPARTAIHPFEAVEIGQPVDLGAHLFDRKDVLRFGRLYDPQPFHTDEEAASRSHFGGLVASGWHTAAVWMRRLVDGRREAVEEAQANGRPPPKFGPSPGLKDLRWLRPVFAGDTISFATIPVDKRLSASRPGWGIVFSRNTGVNQKGELVFEFSGSGFLASAEANGA